MCLVIATHLGCHALLSIWLFHHGVNFLPNFATLYDFTILSHTFVAATLSKLRLGKLWLGTKLSLTLSLHPQHTHNILHFYPLLAKLFAVNILFLSMKQIKVLILRGILILQIIL
jgi:hypothetical protein